ncbi:MAG: hypothetical protein SF182_15780 [Deltaproteobacteria bacterium]|nr:hypothetical protein [Deltaproteobacteria bacterium]
MSASLVLLGGALVGAALTPTDAALSAVDAAPVAIFAARDAHGAPTGWPMTPYRDGGRAVVTSTLAFLDKTEAVRRDGRVALLAGGWLIQGTAAVHADPSGDEFVRRFLATERRKYPPVESILAVPLHRWLFDWYFGRAFMEITPRRVRAVAGSDAATLLTLDGDGLPVITPIAAPPQDAAGWPLHTPDGAPLADLPDRRATVLLHVEDAAMRDLRQVHLRGVVRGGAFTVERRRGTLAPSPPRGWWTELSEQWALRRRGRAGRARIERWSDGAPR